MGQSSAVLRYTLYFVNFLACLEGLLMLMLAFYFTFYTHATEGGGLLKLLVTDLGIILPACLFLAAVFGCYGACSESQRILKIYGTVLSICLAIQIIIGVFIFRDQYKKHTLFNMSMDLYGKDERATNFWDDMHVQCCRRNGSEAYTVQGLEVPSACTCEDKSASCKSRERLEACFHKVTERITTSYSAWFSGFLFLVLTKLAGVLLSFRLASSHASNNELQLDDQQILLSPADEPELNSRESIHLSNLDINSDQSEIVN